MKLTHCLTLLALLAGPGSTALAAEEAKPAEGAEVKINYTDHIQPIFREHCYSCHSQDDANSDLALDNYGATMQGGAGGPSVEPGNVDGSRLWKLVAHLESPKMPPEQDKLPEEQLALIKKWIELGALETATSKAKISKPSVDLSGTAATGKPAGEPVMPEGLSRDPVVYHARPGAATAIASSPWAPLVAIAGQKQILLYHSETWQLLGVLPFPEGIPHVLKFSRSGSLLLAGGGQHGKSGKVVLYDVQTGQRLTEIGDELDVVLAADIDARHQFVALGGPRKVLRVYRVADGELAYESRKHTDWIYSIEFSPDGVLLASSDRSGGLVVWESEHGYEYQTLVGHTQAVTAVSWRADSNVLASVSEDGTLKLWEMEAGRMIKSANVHSGGAMSVHLARDGNIVTGGRDKTVKLWKPDASALRALPAFSDFALEVAFTHDGKHVVGGDLSGEFRVWETESGKQIATLAQNPPTLAMLIAETAARAKQAADEAAKAEAARTAAAKVAADRSAAAAAAGKTANETQQAAEALAAESTKLAQELAAKAAAMKAAEEALAKAQAALEKSKAEHGQVAKLSGEKATAAKAAQEKAAAAKTQAEKLAADKAAADKELAEKAVAAKAAAEKAAAAKAEADRVKQEAEATRTAQVDR